MTYHLDGRRVLVTGASGGMGGAIALRLAEAGADIAVHYYQGTQQAEQLATQIEQLGRQALLVQADIADGDETKQMFAQVAESLGGLDILVNNAGIVRDQYLAFMTEEQFQEVLQVCLAGAWRCTKLAAKLMLPNRWGRIINMSSDAGLMGDLRRTNYSAAKAGLIGMTKAAARELAQQGITVNAIAPGIIETKLIGDMNDSYRQGMLDQIPLGRFGEPARPCLDREYPFENWLKQLGLHPAQDGCQVPLHLSRKLEYLGCRHPGVSNRFNQLMMEGILN